MAWGEAGGEVEELLKEKGSVLECSGVPPLNLLCRKPVFLGLDACGVSELFSPAQASVWREVC